MNQRRFLLMKKKILLMKLLRLGRKKKIQRSIWVKEEFRERKQHGHFWSLIPTLRKHNPDGFKNYLRVTPAQFDDLVSLVRPFLQKKSSRFRSAIQPDEMLALTLRYLAAGDSMRSVSYNFRIGYSTASSTINRTCSAIWEALSSKYMKVPSSSADWEKIAQVFNDRWNFPNCVGAIDGKHVAIQAPDNSGSLYFNYKEFYSLVLLAICDGSYKFTYIDVGNYGRHSDSAIFSSSLFGQCLANGELNLPQDSIIPGTNMTAPYVFLGDEAFPLKCHLMRPFPNSNNLDERKQTFNYRLCRARRIIENSFGILTARWRIFRQPIQAKVETIEEMVKAACVLHNYIIHKKLDFSVDSEDGNGRIVKGSWRVEVPDLAATSFRNVTGGHCNNFSLNAGQVREVFADYFNSEIGLRKCPWQLKHIKRN